VATGASFIVDGIIIGIIAISALLAFARGFVREFLTVAAVAAAGVAAYYLFTTTNLKDTARNLLPNELVADGATIVVIFVVVLVVALVVTHPIAERVRGSNLGFLDRWLGFIWGAIRGALIVVVLYVPIEALLFPVGSEQPAWLTEARLMPYVEQTSDWLISLVPQGLRDATRGLT
jgi:membrane protein required for colicin V production